MQKILCPASLVSSSLRVRIACLVILMYLFSSVLSRLAHMLSPSFFGVKTTLLHHTVGSSPASLILSIPSHFINSWSNLCSAGWISLVVFEQPPWRLGQHGASLRPFLVYRHPETHCGIHPPGQG